MKSTIRKCTGANYFPIQNMQEAVLIQNAKLQLVGVSTNSLDHEIHNTQIWHRCKLFSNPKYARSCPHPECKVSISWCDYKQLTSMKSTIRKFDTGANYFPIQNMQEAVLIQNAKFQLVGVSINSLHPWNPQYANLTPVQTIFQSKICKKLSSSRMQSFSLLVWV